jgi:hypothetical protein
LTPADRLGYAAAMPTEPSPPPEPPALQDDELAWLILALLDTAPKAMTPEEIAEAVARLTAAAKT